jgi:hypothetical protein
VNARNRTDRVERPGEPLLARVCQRPTRGPIRIGNRLALGIGQEQGARGLFEERADTPSRSGMTGWPDAPGGPHCPSGASLRRPSGRPTGPSSSLRRRAPVDHSSLGSKFRLPSGGVPIKNPRLPTPTRRRPCPEPVCASPLPSSESAISTPRGCRRTGGWTRSWPSSTATARRRFRLLHRPPAWRPLARAPGVRPRYGPAVSAAAQLFSKAAGHIGPHRGPPSSPSCGCPSTPPPRA